jgi:hypothetical protein
MPAILPIGYVTFGDAARTIERALFSGEPDRLEVIQARIALGDDVGDGVTSSKATAALWEAIDAGALRLVAIGGRPRKIITLDPDFTRDVPFLRRVLTFTYLRPSHREWKHVTAWFGTNLSDVILAVRETELSKLAPRLRRRRRRKQPEKAGIKAGRPSKQQSIGQAIEFIVKGKQWNTRRSIKELTQLVNRDPSVRTTLSADTVTRALDAMFETTRDRQYARIRRVR